MPGQMEFTDAKSFEQCMNPPVEEIPPHEAFETLRNDSIQKQWVSFSALLSTEDALALRAFFESRNIEFKPV